MNAYSLTYFFIIVLCIVTILISPKRYYKKIIPSFSILFAAQQYMFLRANSIIDVNRFYDNMNSIRNIRYLAGYEGVVSFLSNHYDYSTQPLAGAYLVLCSLIQNNYFILFLTGIVVSLNILNLMKMVSIDSDLSKSGLCVMFTIFFLSYDMFRAISGVRFAIASSFFALLFYMLQTKRIKKSMFLLTSALLALCHTSIWLYLVIYLATTVLKHSLFRYLAYGIALFFGSINNILIDLVAKLPIPIIAEYFVNKNARYYDTDKYAVGFLIINFLMIGLIVIYFFSEKYINKIKNDYTQKRDYQVFLIILFLLVIGSYRIVDLQNRTLILLNLLSIPIIGDLFNMEKNFFEDKKALTQIVLRILAISIAFMFFSLNSITLNNFF